MITLVMVIIAIQISFYSFPCRKKNEENAKSSGIEGACLNVSNNYTLRFTEFGNLKGLSKNSCILSLIMGHSDAGFHYTVCPPEGKRGKCQIQWNKGHVYHCVQQLYTLFHGI